VGSSRGLAPVDRCVRLRVYLRTHLLLPIRTVVKVMALKRPDICVSCATPVAAGQRAGWEPSAKAVTCLQCPAPPGSQSSPGLATTTASP
jgi:hypothetical protein